MVGQHRILQSPGSTSTAVSLNPCLARLPIPLPNSVTSPRFSAYLSGVGSVDVANLAFGYASGPVLLNEVSFKVGAGDHTALVGANGVGKTTMLRLIAGELQPTEGAIGIDGPTAFMSQMIGMQEGVTLQELYLNLSPGVFREASKRLNAQERRIVREPSDDANVKYANALAHWEAIGGYDLEVLWAECADRAIGLPWSKVADRATDTFSGGEQKRLALELLFRSEFETLLLDEPDNFLDVPGKRWLAEQMNACRKTLLFISHDRELLAEASRKVVTLEARGSWTHGESFATWADARAARLARIDDENQRWAQERQRLVRNMREMKRRAAMSDANASRAKAAETRLRHYDESERPAEQVADQKIDMRLEGGRTGKRVVMAEQLELTDLTFPFDTEIWFGDRVAVVGMNGTGKSHFLRLLNGGDVNHEGEWKLGARVVPGLFSQTHEHPELLGRTLVDVLAEDHIDGQINAQGKAMSLLRRYELQNAGEQPWETLSGGQQARFQILLLELGGATLLLLDEPTDNLDVASAEALEAGLSAFTGTVIAVSHDRWFLRSFEQFLVFDQEGEVHHATDPEMAWTA